MDISFDNVNDAAGYKEREHHWVYYKPLFLELLGTPHGVYPEIPKKYPVVLKPVINLEGLSAGAMLAHEEKDLERHPGHFWMPVLEGRHVSVDILVRDGVAQLVDVVEGHPSEWFGGFDYWERVKTTSTDRRLIGKLMRRLELRNGHFNVEYIGDVVIEFHLRRAREFDPLRNGLRYAVPVLVHRSSWLPEAAFKKFLKTLKVPRAKSVLYDGGWPEISSSGRHRYAVLYGDDLAVLKAARTETIKALGKLAKIK